MRKVVVKDTLDLIDQADNVMNKLYKEMDLSEYYPCVNIVASRDVIDEVVLNLLYYYDANIYVAHIEPYEVIDTDIYTLTLSSDGLWIEPTYMDGEWEIITDITFVHGDVNSQFLVANADAEDMIIEFDYDDTPKGFLASLFR